MTKPRLPDCGCEPYYPAGYAPWHSSFCPTRANTKLSRDEADVWRALLKASRGNAQGAEHPVYHSPEDVPPSPDNWSWSERVWDSHGRGRTFCRCLHCAYVESVIAMAPEDLPDDDLARKERLEMA